MTKSNTIKFSPMELSKQYASVTQGIYFPIMFHKVEQFPLLHILHEALIQPGTDSAGKFKKYKALFEVGRIIKKDYLCDPENELAKKIIKDMRIYRHCFRKSLAVSSKDLEQLLHDVADLEEGVEVPDTVLALGTHSVKTRVQLPKPDAVDTIKKSFSEIFEFE